MSDTVENFAQLRLEPKSKTAERIGVHIITIDRWVKAGILEKPVKINRRDYFRRDAWPVMSIESA